MTHDIILYYAPPVPIMILHALITSSGKWLANFDTHTHTDRKIQAIAIMDGVELMIIIARLGNLNNLLGNNRTLSTTLHSAARHFCNAAQSAVPRNSQDS